MPYKVLQLKGNSKAEDIERAINELESSGYTLVEAYLGPQMQVMLRPEHVLIFRKK